MLCGCAWRDASSCDVCRLALGARSRPGVSMNEVIFKGKHLFQHTLFKYSRFMAQGRIRHAHGARPEHTHARAHTRLPSTRLSLHRVRGPRWEPLTHMLPCRFRHCTAWSFTHVAFRHCTVGCPSKSIHVREA